MAQALLWGAVVGVKCLIEGYLEGKRRDAKRLEEMEKQHESAIAKLRDETIEEVRKAGKAAVEEYKEALIKQREEYPRPKYLPNDGVPTIGVMGESGTGKSTFFNTILGKNVAATGTGETTVVPQMYRWGDVRLVDLPGGCTTKFKAEDYFQKFGIRYYDVIVCLSSDARLKELGMDAVKHLTKNNVPTIFVLSKIDSVLRGEAVSKGLSQEAVLDEMKTKFDAAFSQYYCPVYFISAIEVQEECGSLQAAGSREVSLKRPVNRDWLPLLHIMKMEAMLRNKLLKD